jgi:hypothetical protein
MTCLPKPPSSAFQRAQSGRAVKTLRDNRLFRTTILTKTQIFLAVGEPILMGVRGDAAEMVQETGVGIVFSTHDSEVLAEAIETLLFMPDNWRMSKADFSMR